MARKPVFALTEPGAGSDVAAITSNAREVGDEYCPQRREDVDFARHQGSPRLVGATIPKQKPHEGLSAFLVELDRTPRRTSRKIGRAAGSTGWINCQDVHVDPICWVWRVQGLRDWPCPCLDNGRYTVASGATGLDRASLDASIKYSKERKAFGEEITKYQLVQQNSRMVQSNGAYLFIPARRLDEEPGSAQYQREASLAKWFATDK